MSVVSQYIASGVYNYKLVVGVDTFSKIIDWNRCDRVLFGDGAGAAVLSDINVKNGFLVYLLYSDGIGKNNFTIPAGGSEFAASMKTLNDGMHYLKKNDRVVYDTATKVLLKAINQVLESTGLTMGDIDYMIPY